MASFKDNVKFKNECITDYLLDNAIDFIKTYLRPEDVFSADQLNYWADTHYECNCEEK